MVSLCWLVKFILSVIICFHSFAYKNILGRVSQIVQFTTLKHLVEF